MKATAERLEKSTVLLEVEVEAERFSQAVERACRKLARDVAVPGFRKGKVPRVILERYLGKERLYQEATALVLGEVYPAAVKDAGIEPVSQPEVEVIEAEEGKPLVFKAKVEVKPEVKLGDYKGLEVTRQVKAVTPEDVATELERLRDRYARLVTVEEGAVAKNDIVKIDYEGTIDGEAIPGGSAKEKEVEVGLGYLLPELEEALVGMRPGETKEVRVVFPSDHREETLAGKEAVFKLTVRAIRRKELLPLDNDFAKEVSEFDTLAELKADLENKLREAALKDADLFVRQEIVRKAVENAQFELPPSMVASQVEEMLEDIVATADGRGVSPERLFGLLHTTPEEMRERIRPDAERNLKTRLVLDAIAKTEGITASDAEVNEEIAKVAGLYRQEPAELRQALADSGKLDFVRQKLVREKTVQFLVDNARVIEAEAAETARQEAGEATADLEAEAGAATEEKP
uniref:Trigger factor n=1 Tax=Ammonifex degensii TaxID=42838 RepID=A0A7C2E3G3_9THEO